MRVSWLSDQHEKIHCIYHVSIFIQLSIRSVINSKDMRFIKLINEDVNITFWRIQRMDIFFQQLNECSTYLEHSPEVWRACRKHHPVSVVLPPIARHRHINKIFLLTQGLECIHQLHGVVVPFEGVVLLWRRLATVHCHCNKRVHAYLEFNLNMKNSKLDQICKLERSLRKWNPMQYKVEVVMKATRFDASSRTQVLESNIGSIIVERIDLVMNMWIGWQNWEISSKAGTWTSYNSLLRLQIIGYFLCVRVR